MLMIKKKSRRRKEGSRKKILRPTKREEGKWKRKNKQNSNTAPLGTSKTREVLPLPGNPKDNDETSPPAITWSGVP